MSEQSDTSDKPKSRKIHIDVAGPRSYYVTGTKDPLEQKLRRIELDDVANMILQSRRCISRDQAYAEADRELLEIYSDRPSVNDIIMKVLGIVAAIVMIPLFIWSMVRIYQAW